MPGLATVNRLSPEHKMSEALDLLLAFFLFILVIVLPLGTLVCWLFRREIRKSVFGRRVLLALGRIPIVGSALTSSPPAPLPDNVLASGNGRGNSAIVSSWAVCIVGAVVCIAMGAYGAGYIGSEFADEKTELERRLATAKGQPFVDRGKIAQAERQLAQADQITKQVVVFIGGLSILGLIALLVYGAFYHRSIAGTYIHVSSNGIEGKGAGKGFTWGSPRLFGFKLNYNQITSVDTTGTAIFIHASGAQYKCYVKNPAEIQKVIVEQQRAGSGA